MKHLLKFLTGGLGLALILSGCGEKKAERSKFAVVTTGVASFWDICKIGAEKAGADLDVDVEVLMPNGGVEQKSKMEDLLSRGVDGIAAAVIDPINQSEFFDEVAERVEFITVDTDAPDSKRKVYIGVDNYDAGRMCGQLVKEALPEGGQVILFIGRLEQDNSKRRRQGVIDELLDRSRDPSRYDAPGAPVKGEKYTVLATLTDQFDRAKGKANAEDMLTKYPKVGCMVGLFAYNPPLILEALSQAKRLNTVKVVGFDEEDVTLQAIVDGTVHGTVVQNPYEYGYQSVKVLKALFEGDDSMIPANKFINIPARQIRKDTVTEFWADLNEKLGK
ncbi:sugar-binding protein [Akkermansiaceae bacterium]|jgi:ribose transport system substrate-binding protein|nr:sugar-binding protein [Akkermansiaceae bacterium]MDB4460976.1 sugar-binding protein [bacterium]MDB4519247.1 sugar-binding protein [Akkermansiaceae bacterium]|tara:strand:- start:950 stop:1948 length:999 start_codon:yes stop_codon:yes gene_type:complete